MELSDRIYKILTIEVERLEAKQSVEGLDRNDVALLATLTRTAADIHKATPPEPEPTEGMSEEDLLSMVGTIDGKKKK